MKTLLPKERTTDYDQLNAYVEHINRLNGGSASSLFAIRNDRIVAEYYGGEANGRPTAADSQFNVASVRKSYYGLAAAWALERGAVRSLDDPVLRYVTADQEERALLDGITIRHLLTHTHGLARDESGSLIRSFDPGTDWQYNNEGIRFLTELLSNVLGDSISGFLADNVFRPLGWQETGWRTALSETLVPVVDDAGTAVLIEARDDGSGGNLFVSARELAYWGYLHLKLGTVNGESIVPASVIRQSIAIQSPAGLPAGHPRNGCLWLVKDGESAQCLIGDEVPAGSFEIVGLYGPLVLVVPELDLVVVRMANRVGNYSDENGTYVDYLKAFSNLAVAANRVDSNGRPGNDGLFQEHRGYLFMG